MPAALRRSTSVAAEGTQLRACAARRPHGRARSFTGHAGRGVEAAAAKGLSQIEVRQANAESLPFDTGASIWSAPATARITGRGSRRPRWKLRVCWHRAVMRSSSIRSASRTRWSTPSCRASSCCATLARTQSLAGGMAPLLQPAGLIELEHADGRFGSSSPPGSRACGRRRIGPRSSARCRRCAAGSPAGLAYRSGWLVHHPDRALLAAQARLRGEGRPGCTLEHPPLV